MRLDLIRYSGQTHTEVLPGKQRATSALTRQLPNGTVVEVLQIGAGRSESSPSALREATGLLREIGQPVASGVMHSQS